ncbi:MAG: hypothetical protein HeimC3_28050 [Candidatus Heimdallarchaeota archaeon LC_3]|nr:MAG: hypothetical protein HeimC3_28050 [Candidatus Heimdallarchaeota archaeon LC_3]
MGVKFTSKDIFYICRGFLKEEEFPENFHSVRDALLKRMETTTSVASQSENLGLQHDLFRATIPAIELISFFRELLDLGKKDDAVETMHYVLNPELADLIFRRRYVNRLPYVDSDGTKVPVPDQPIVGRYNSKNSLSTLFGEEPFYQVRILHIFAQAAYYDILKIGTIPDSSKEWIKEKIAFSRFLKPRSEEEIKKDILFAIDINLIRRYWDNLLSDIRRSFYGLRNYSGLASKTQHLITELLNTPNVIYTLGHLKKRVIKNIKSGVQFYFIHTYKMPQEDVVNLIKDEENITEFQKIIQNHWDSNEQKININNRQMMNFEPFYRESWVFWSKVRSRYLELKREELSKDFMFIQEQKKVIDSLDTLGKKQYTTINEILWKKPIGTEYEILDRAIAIFGLELTEVALSHPNITQDQKKAFMEHFIDLFKSEIDFLLPRVKPEIYEEKTDPNTNQSEENNDPDLNKTDFSGE